MYVHVLITHKIYVSFDANPSLEVRGVFLDISKASVEYDMKGLLISVEGDLLTFIEPFLFERQQKVILNGEESEWLTIKAGVPQVQFLVHYTAQRK